MLRRKTKEYFKITHSLEESTNVMSVWIPK